MAASRRTKVSEVAVTMCRWPSPGCRRGPLERPVMSIPHAMSSVVGVFCPTHCSSTIETRQAALQGDDDIASPSVDEYSLLGHKYHRSSCPDGAQVWFASSRISFEFPQLSTRRSWGWADIISAAPTLLPHMHHVLIWSTRSVLYLGRQRPLIGVQLLA